MVLILPVFVSLLIVAASIPLSLGLLIKTDKVRWLLLSPVTALILFFPTVYERAFLLANGLVWRQGFDGQWVGLSRTGAATTGLQHQPPFGVNVDTAEGPLSVSFLVRGPALWPQNSWDRCPGQNTSFGLTESLPSSMLECFREVGGEDKFYYDADSLVRCSWFRQGTRWDKQTNVRTCIGNFVESSIEVTVFLSEIDLAHWRDVKRNIRPIVRQAFVVWQSP